MVKEAAKRTFDGQLELGRQLAEAEFMRQVAEQKIRGERMFQEEVEKGRQEAEKRPGLRGQERWREAADQKDQTRKIPFRVREESSVTSVTSSVRVGSSLHCLYN